MNPFSENVSNHDHQSVAQFYFLGLIFFVCWTVYTHFVPQNFSFTNQKKQVEPVAFVENAPKIVAATAPANEYAPIAPSNLDEDRAKRYINKYAKVAISEMKKYRIPASISLAQGLVESRAGTSTLARKNNNHFGIKCFSKKCKKGHCTNHHDDGHKDFFRKYKSAWYSWRAHSKLLQSKRYNKLKAYGFDYRRWAYGLQKAGYATDQRYARKLIGTIEAYNLQRFDH